MEKITQTAGSKILVAYFTATNNTEGVVQKLADGLGTGCGHAGAVSEPERSGKGNGKRL